jgi:murein DD-endopeptidase MepM/ murein hydrolase activator NlpD
MGSTGNSTGVHLHFGVFTGYSSDPLGYTNVNSSARMTCGGITYYNPSTVVNNNRLPRQTIGVQRSSREVKAQPSIFLQTFVSKIQPL